MFRPISNSMVGNHHRESHPNLPVSSAVGAHPNAETGRSFLHCRLIEPNLTPSTVTQPLSAAADHVFRQNIATSCAAIPGVAHRDDGVQKVDKPRRDDESRVHLVGNPSLHTKLTQILLCPAPNLSVLYRSVLYRRRHFVYFVRQRSCGLRTPKLVN